MEDQTALATVLAWQKAANDQDSAAVLSLSSPDIEIVGPRGTAKGHEILRDWLTRAGLTLNTKRLFARGDAVVLAQHGMWRSPESGDVVGQADVATAYRVNNGQVAWLARYDTIAEALEAAGISQDDEQAQD